MNIKNLLLGVINDFDLLNYYNAKIFYKKLCPEILGYVFNNQGLFCIVINEYLSIAETKDTIIHELAHMELNQLEQKDKDYLFAFCRNDLEDEVDKYLKDLEKEICDLEKR